MSIACRPPWPSSKPDARKALIRWRNALNDADRQQRTDRIARAVTDYLQAYLQRVSSGEPAAADQPSGQAAGDAGDAPIRVTRCNHAVRPVLGVFWPIRGEPNLKPWYPRWQEAGFDLALPVTPDQPGPLTFVRWDPADAMTADAMGVQVPVARVSVVPAVLVIPCVGFGDNGLRLGYGGGYYDRTLTGYPGESVGVAFADSYLPGLRASAHDCRLSCILTDDS